MIVGKARHTLKERFYPLLDSAVFIGIIIVVFLFLFLAFHTQPSFEMAVKKKLASTPTPIMTLTPTVTQNIKTFTSPDLGISFTYNGNSLWDGKPVQVKEIGNRVYLYAWDAKPEDGRFVEVFHKDPKDSLLDAITKRFLQGYSAQDCQVSTARLGKIYYDRSGFVYAQTRPVEAPNPIESLPQLASKCPPVYTTLNSLSYFLMNIAHPDRFVFVNVGQDTIDSGRTGIFLTWDQTIQFLNNK